MHKATLRSTGEAVVVKVQHRNVKRIIIKDFGCLRVIMEWVAYFEPEYDFRPVIDAWLEVAVKELDFRQEADNMMRVRANLERHGVKCTVPAIIPGMVTSQVIVMEFCQGFKVKKKAKKKKKKKTEEEVEKKKKKKKKRKKKKKKEEESTAFTHFFF